MQKSITLPIYANGMITKLKLTIYPETVPTVAFDGDYGTEFRMEANCVAFLSNLIGRVGESIDGQMLGSGILADYYFGHLTVLSADGLHVRNQGFFPEFITRLSPKGNVLPPTFDLRDFNSNTGDVSMISITGLPSAYRPILISAIAAQLMNMPSIDMND